ncbi:MAG: hypothetical protein AAGF83_11010 [Cyanobacteria bacterium P01_G01_bin.67]
MPDYPKQPEKNLIGKYGERIFSGCLPLTWIASSKPESDLGEDFSVEIWTEEENPVPTGLRFAAQVKCHKHLPEKRNRFPEYSNDKVFTPIICHQKIKTTTLNYLSLYNGQLFTFYLNACGETSVYIKNFCNLFDPDTACYLDNTAFDRQGSFNKLMFVTNLVTIAELIHDHLPDFADKTINIPLIYQNSNIVSSNLFVLERSQNFSEKHDYSCEEHNIHYENTYGIEHQSIVFPTSWKFRLYQSLTNNRYKDIDKIRFVPFLPLENKSEILFGYFNYYKEDTSALVEILISVAHCVRSSEFSWVLQILNSNASLNFLTLKCVRVHKLSLSTQWVSKYISTTEESTEWFWNHIFNGRCGKSFRRSYYDELIYYLKNQIESGNTLYVTNLFYELLKLRVLGLNSLFEQLTNGKQPQCVLEVAISCIEKQTSITTNRISDSTAYLIKLARSIGIEC